MEREVYGETRRSGNIEKNVFMVFDISKISKKERKLTVTNY